MYLERYLHRRSSLLSVLVFARCCERENQEVGWRGCSPDKLLQYLPKREARKIGEEVKKRGEQGELEVL